MIAMKSTISKNAGTRSVKVSDPIHHRLRVLAAQKRMRLQVFIDNMLATGIKRRIYDDFLPGDEAPKE